MNVKNAKQKGYYHKGYIATLYMPVFKFSYNGKTIEEPSTVRSTKRYEIGQAVEILYNPIKNSAMDRKMNDKLKKIAILLIIIGTITTFLNVLV